MSGPAKTRLFLLATLVAVLVWEGLALMGILGPVSTISESWWALIDAFPLASLLLGILIGHLMWQRRTCIHCGLRPW